MLARPLSRIVVALAAPCLCLVVPFAAAQTNYTFTHFAGSSGGYGYFDGTGSAAQFDGPRGVATDSSGNVYVADAGNSTIRKITPAGAVTTLAGLAGSYGRGDGTGSAARFTYPRGVATDSSGNVYVADAYNNTIREITPAGVTTTLAGDGSFGSSDGTVSAARFYLPRGVATDSSGNVYVADAYNNTIQEAILFTAVSQAYTFSSCDHFAWSFGDGTSVETTEPSISHQFAAGVARTVTLTVTNNSGSATASVQDVSPPTATSCTPSISQACLNGGRYAVTLDALTRDMKKAAVGQVTRQTDLFGYFSLPAFTSDATNPEVFVKVVGPINGSPLVFYSGLTDVEYFVNVLDVQTGVLRQYHVPPAANPAVSKGDFDLDDAHASTCSNTVRTTTTEMPGTCTPDANTLCLMNNRFKLSVVGRDDPARTGKTAAGVATPVSGKQFGFFSFPALTNDPANLEVVVKMIDAASVDPHFWVFFGGLTDFEFALKVTDTTTGKTQTYLKPLFNPCGLNDTTGFP